MTGESKTSRAVLYAVSIFLVLIWAASFAISYTTLVNTSLTAGIVSPFCWLFPLELDFFMSIASLDVIRREMNNESTKPAWVVVIGVTIVSTIFNITQAQPSALSWCVFGLSPIVCMISLHTFIGVLRSHFHHQHQRDNAAIPTQKPTPKPGTTTKPAKATRVKRGGTTPETRDVITSYYHEHPGTSYAEAARDIGISRHVVRATMLKIAQSQQATAGEA